jgi:hypothetical protein
MADRVEEAMDKAEEYAQFLRDRGFVVSFAGDSKRMANRLDLICRALRLALTLLNDPRHLKNYVQWRELQALRGGRG